LKQAENQNMAVTTTKIHLSGLARKLVLDGLLEQEAAEKAHQDALKKKTPLVSYLVENGIVSGDKIALAASQEFGVPLLDIKSIEIDPDITKLVKEDLVQKHHALPIFKRGKRLYLAVSDPTNLLALDEIKFAVSMNTERPLKVHWMMLKVVWMTWMMMTWMIWMASKLQRTEISLMMIPILTMPLLSDL